MASFQRIFKPSLEVVEEEETNGDDIDPSDPVFLAMANKKTSDITDFRDTEYVAEKERLERHLDDKKGDLDNSMTLYSATRKERRSKQDEVDRIEVVEKVQSDKVSQHIHQVNETSHALDNLNLKHKYSVYLDEKNRSPKIYQHWTKAQVREHSNLETSEQWEALQGMSIEMLVVTHGHRCTSLGLQSDPDNPNSRVFTYSPKKVGDDLEGTRKESPAQYIERLKKAMGWYAQPEVQDAIRKRRITELQVELAKLVGGGEQQQQHNSELPPAKKLKTGEHGAEHAEE
jgi:hypothetical protein